MIKKILISRHRNLAIIFVSIVLGWGVFWIFSSYQTLPQYIMPSVPEIALPEQNQTVLVFAPHCDDETLGAGGYINKALEAKANVRVVMATNGDGHYMGTVEEFGKLYPKSSNYIESGYVRQKETISAMSVFGLDQSNIIFLGYPDGGTKLMLKKYWDKPYKSPYTNETVSPYNNSYRPHQAYTGINMENDIYEIVNQYKPDIIVVSSSYDRHPDHSALYEYVKKAIEKSDRKPSLYTYLVHFKYFPHPSGLKKNSYLTPPLTLIGFEGIWNKLDLSSDLENKKQVAIERYQSQIKVPFLRKLMIGFIRKNELFFNIRY